MTVDQLYEEQIKYLSYSEQLRLVARITQALIVRSANEASPAQHDIMELHGLGKEIWAGIDAQTYVNELREEWDHRL